MTFPLQCLPLTCHCILSVCVCSPLSRHGECVCQPQLRRNIHTEDSQGGRVDNHVNTIRGPSFICGGIYTCCFVNLLYISINLIYSVLLQFGVTQDCGIVHCFLIISVLFACAVLTHAVIHYHVPNDAITLLITLLILGSYFGSVLFIDMPQCEY